MQRKQYLIAILAILLTSSTMLSFTTARYVGLRQTVTSLAWDVHRTTDSQKLAQLTKAYANYMSQQGIGSMSSKALMQVEQDDYIPGSIIELLFKYKRGNQLNGPLAGDFGGGHVDAFDDEDLYEDCLVKSGYRSAKEEYRKLVDSDEGLDTKYINDLIKLYQSQMDMVYEICAPLRVFDEDPINNETHPYEICLKNSGYYQLNQEFFSYVQNANQDTFEQLREWFARYREHMDAIRESCAVYKDPQP